MWKFRCSHQPFQLYKPTGKIMLTTRCKIQTTQPGFPTISRCFQTTMKGEFLSIYGTEGLQQHLRAESNSRARCRIKKKGNGWTYFNWPEQLLIDVTPFLIWLQGNNYGSYKPHTFKEAFQNLLPQPQQSHGFFKTNLQQVNIGKSREALFKQVWLTHED